MFFQRYYLDCLSLASYMIADEKTTIVDIRSQSEWDSGHIAGSLNIPLNQLQERLTEIPLDQTVIVHCQGGYRSSIAASLLEKQAM